MRDILIHSPGDAYNDVWFVDRQTIIWTSDDLWEVGPLGTNICEISKYRLENMEYFDPNLMCQLLTASGIVYNLSYAVSLPGPN